MPFTRGFRDELDLDDHFDKHGSDCGVTTKERYQDLADYFLGSKPRRETVECKDSKGDLIRGDTETEEFGVVTKHGFIRTYYRVKFRDKRRYPTMREYVMEKCRK